MNEQQERREYGPGLEEDETVQSLAEIHDRHRHDIGAIQKWANSVTGTLGQPGAVMLIMAAIVCWLGWNAFAADMGSRPLDPFPFPDLTLFATVSAFLVTLLILTTQRHEQHVNRRRDQLTLHMAVLTEKKIAKAIALLEELRRDDPSLPSRDDRQAAAMAEPSDPRKSLDRIEGSDTDG